MPEPNWVNRTLWTGDNLEVMRGMNDDCVDLSKGEHSMEHLRVVLREEGIRP